MSLALVDFADRLVSISDLSRGKAGKVFADVEENNNDYIILKNNQPTAVLVSMKKYKETQQKIARLEKMLEAFEDIRLHRLAKEADTTETTSFDDFVLEHGYSMKDVDALAESVEIE